MGRKRTPTPSFCIRVMAGGSGERILFPWLDRGGEGGVIDDRIMITFYAQLLINLLIGRVINHFCIAMKYKLLKLGIVTIIFLTQHFINLSWLLLIIVR